MDYAIALGTLTLAIVEVMALVGIWLRYAIPRAPVAFHILLTVPMLTAAFTALAIGWDALAGDLWGIPLEVWRLGHVWSQSAVFSILISYAVYHHLRGRKCPV